MRILVLVFAEAIKAIIEVLEEVSIFLVRIPIDMVAGLVWIVLLTGAFLRFGRLQKWAASMLKWRPVSLRR